MHNWLNNLRDTINNYELCIVHYELKQDEIILAKLEKVENLIKDFNLLEKLLGDKIESQNYRYIEIK